MNERQAIIARPQERNLIMGQYFSSKTFNRVIGLITLIFHFSCGTMQSGHFIQLRHTDTLDGLSKEFKVAKAHILNSNRERKFREGEWWFIPLKRGIAYAISGGAQYANINYSAEFLTTGKFLWPVPTITKISSHFGRRWGRPHTGLDIPGKIGTDIIAAEDGVVSFSGRMSGYGKVIVIKHGGNYSTVYAHNNKNIVKKGQKVYRGQLIAELGNSGKSTGAHLHFEIRKNEEAVNPLAYIRNSRNYVLAFQKK